ncbi:peptidoglycan synthetase [Putridiphycobacter roseus]|uniref:Peptidoglycan synthetase n=1 Tax=Putridiphycobacter roseus TaxID=2219161 RepID=A0A2W1NME0_9FLAO|nr:Mur ligase family protein [Putridiphycobacter roseus]PZE16812.1 peptidoglycan synthetase [Putridiphycobacter roseus]
MHVHFIAIGGSAMHNLAMALKRKGLEVTGSDDEIFEPSKSRLKKEGIYPKKMGWNVENIHPGVDAIILGMHARKDNPELLAAQEMGLKIYSYPEFVYEQSKDQIRIVIGGSHGKTSITSMILHVMQNLEIKTDFLVGALLDGFDCMVQFSDAKYMLIEGDEYLSSPLDLRPKFHWYKPNIALLSGVAWDHINVFPTFENYVEQFKIFAEDVQENGKLIYFEKDPVLQNIAGEIKQATTIPYNTLNYTIVNNKTVVEFEGKAYPMHVFGAHNLQNMNGARLILNEIGVSNHDFFNAIQSFKGAAKRLETIAENDKTIVFKDFAHSPSKLKATTQAVKEQFPERKLIACMELHTFSSLKKAFLPEYKNAMAAADKAYVYFSPEVVKHKKLAPITAEDVRLGFGTENVTVFTDSTVLFEQLEKEMKPLTNLLLMSSGNFNGIDLNDFAKKVML